MGSAVALAIELLDALPGLVTATEGVINAITNTSTALKAMQAEGRDPTDAEWAALRAQMQSLHDEIQGA